MSTVTRPVMRYHGGKWKLAPWIISHFPTHRVYVEPYGGAASVLIRKPRSYAEVYNDLDGEVVNLFRVLRDPETAAQLVTMLELTPFAREEFEVAYKPADDPIEQARRTIVRSFMGFGSAAANGKPTGFRANSNRSGTTPAKDWRNLPKCFEPIIERLRGVVIESRDARVVCVTHDGPETLHYVDPPYVHDTRAQGNPYCDKGQYRHEMTDDDHRAMAMWLKELTGMVVVSGYDCDLYRELFRGWQRADRASHADGARDRVESLWLSPNVNVQGVLV